MAINITKPNQCINIKKIAPALKLKNLTFATGWDKTTSTVTDARGNTKTYNYDLDLIVFMFDKDGVCHEAWTVFYNTTTRITPDGQVIDDPNQRRTDCKICDPSGAVVYSGDNRTGDGDGDDESVQIDTAKLPDYVHKLVFVETIDNPEEKQQNFNGVKNAYVRIEDIDSSQEVLRYDLCEEYSIETAVIAAELSRDENGEWTKFETIGRGVNNGLIGVCQEFGLAYNTD